MNVMRENGVVLVVWEAGLPSLAADGAGGKRIAAFYTRLEQETAAFAERLLERARAEYAASQDPRKRFTFPHYRLSLSVSVTESDTLFFSALRQVRLMRGGRLLAENRHADLFLQHTGRLCPPIWLRLRGFRLPRGKGDLYRKEGAFYRLPPSSASTAASKSACSSSRS